MRVHEVNPCDAHKDKKLFRMWIGTYGTIRGHVWADHFEDAWEEFVEWLDENDYCADFHDLDKSDLIDAADILGLPHDAATDRSHPDHDKVVEKAEEGYTIIGHTTLQNCGQYVLDTEWGGDELDVTPDTLRDAHEACSGHRFLKGDVLEVVSDFEYDGEFLLRGSRWRVTDASPSGFDIESIGEGPHTEAGKDDDDESSFFFESEDGNEKYARDFRIVPPGEIMAQPAWRPSPVDPDEAERKKQMDFFFPKSTLPKPREGGGGLLGVPRDSWLKRANFLRHRAPK